MRVGQPKFLGIFASNSIIEFEAKIPKKIGLAYYTVSSVEYEINETRFRLTPAAALPLRKKRLEKRLLLASKRHPIWSLSYKATSSYHMAQLHSFRSCLRSDKDALFNNRIVP